MEEQRLSGQGHGGLNDEADSLTEWARHAAGIKSLRLHGKRREYVSTGAGRIKLAHGSFDNDVEVVADMLQRMRGAPLAAKVENLTY